MARNLLEEQLSAIRRQKAVLKLKQNEIANKINELTQEEIKLLKELNYD